jgi:hypothetical protein
LLLAGNRLYPVGARDGGILDLIDGKTPMHEIWQRGGQRAIDLVASLYHAGMVEML